MRSPYRPLDAYGATWATSLAVETAENAVARVRRFESDEDATARLAAHCCRACWYFRRPRVGGSAMTTWYCGVCAGEHVAGSTATDRICADCAATHGLCTQCGGDVEMRAKRRKWPAPVAAGTPGDGGTT